LALLGVAEAALAVPRFTSNPVTAATEDASYTYNITTADTQNGQRQVTVLSTLPGNLTLNNVNLVNGSARISGTPVQPGSYPIQLQVRNVSTNQTATQSYTLVVANVNDAPVITGQTPNPIPGQQGVALTIALSHLTVTDPDNTYPTGFTLTVLNGSNYSRNGNTITPNSTFVGNLSVPVRVSDGAANSNTFNLVVSVANQAPVITGQTPNPLQATQGVALPIALSHLTVTDGDDAYPAGFSAAATRSRRTRISSARCRCPCASTTAAPTATRSTSPSTSYRATSRP
jgi:hypothetical protein